MDSPLRFNIHRLSSSSSSALTCEVPNVLNGYVYGCSGSSVIFQTTCFFGCRLGFQGVHGINFVQRVCKADGNWTGFAMSCFRKHSFTNFAIHEFENILFSLCVYKTDYVVFFYSGSMSRWVQTGTWINHSRKMLWKQFLTVRRNLSVYM